MRGRDFRLKIPIQVDGWHTTCTVVDVKKVEENELMVDYLIEIVVIAFTLGGVCGAVAALHLRTNTAADRHNA